MEKERGIISLGPDRSIDTQPSLQFCPVYGLRERWSRPRPPNPNLCVPSLHPSRTQPRGLQTHDRVRDTDCSLFRVRQQRLGTEADSWSTTSWHKERERWLRPLFRVSTHLSFVSSSFPRRLRRVYGTDQDCSPKVRGGSRCAQGRDPFRERPQCHPPPVVSVSGT